MPKVGEIRRSWEIGRANNYKWMWCACNVCGACRWVQLNGNGEPKYKRCFKCSRNGKGDKSSTWKGGRVIASYGYMQVVLEPNDFFYPMVTKQGYVLEHRLVMAKYLGRNLHPWEIVHHKNSIRDDNRIENLQLVSDIGHKQITFFEQRLKYLENENEHLRVRVEALEARVIILEAEQIISAEQIQIK